MDRIPGLGQSRLRPAPRRGGLGSDPRGHARRFRRLLRAAGPRRPRGYPRRLVGSPRRQLRPVRPAIRWRVVVTCRETDQRSATGHPPRVGNGCHGQDLAGLAGFPRRQVRHPHPDLGRHVLVPRVAGRALVRRRLAPRHRYRLQGRRVHRLGNLREQRLRHPHATARGRRLARRGDRSGHAALRSLSVPGLRLGRPPLGGLERERPAVGQGHGLSSQSSGDPAVPVPVDRHSGIPSRRVARDDPQLRGLPAGGAKGLQRLPEAPGRYRRQGMGPVPPPPLAPARGAPHSCLPSRVLGNLRNGLRRPPVEHSFAASRDGRALRRGLRLLGGAGRITLCRVGDRQPDLRRLLLPAGRGLRVPAAGDGRPGLSRGTQDADSRRPENFSQAPERAGGYRPRPELRDSLRGGRPTGSTEATPTATPNTRATGTTTARRTTRTGMP